MARKRKPTLRNRYDEWLEAHPVLACALVGAGVAAALVCVFWFQTFTDFGASAEFIYNQF